VITNLSWTGKTDGNANGVVSDDAYTTICLSSYFQDPKIQVLAIIGSAVWCQPCNQEEPELVSLLEGYGHRPILVTGGFDGEAPAAVHQRFAAALDAALAEIAAIQTHARETGAEPRRPRWPMIVLRTPKGWTGPKEVDGLPVEDSWRSHQVPMTDVRDNPAHLQVLEDWLRSYEPHQLFDENGTLIAELADLAPKGERRMSATPHANGGLLLRELVLPDFRDYAVDVPKPGTTTSEATRVLGSFLRDVITKNPDNFRLFGPDETASNRLGDVFEVTNRSWLAETKPTDVGLAPDGRVMEILSEHLCQGWLEGYLLTGRHGLFNCYEAFIHIVDAMFNQHAKWLKVTRQIPWRRPIASLNYLLSSHVWRQDHNGFTHQDPGFVDHVVNKKAEIIRVYLPPDANTLLSVADHCLRSRNYVNVIVAGKQPALNYLSIDDAVIHCTRGLGSWDWASTDEGGEPDVVLGCCGDVPTLETLAAAAILREHVPDLKVRVVNVVDLMRLQPESEHPHGLSESQFDALFTIDRGWRPVSDYDLRQYNLHFHKILASCKISSEHLTNTVIALAYKAGDQGQRIVTNLMMMKAITHRITWTGKASCAKTFNVAEGYMEAGGP